MFSVCGTTRQKGVSLIAEQTFYCQFIIIRGRPISDKKLPFLIDIQVC